MSVTHTAVIALMLGLVAACGDEPTSPRNEGLAPLVRRDGPIPSNRVGVVTRNMYVGANVDAVIAALISPDPADDLPALLGALQVLQATDFPTRARALAREIESTRPDVVGLQEVSQLHADLSPFGFPVTVDADFLPVLLRELSALGLNYSVAATVRNFEAAPVPGIRLVDFDVLLVNERVTVLSVEGGTFGANIGVVAPGVELRRGWVLVRASINGHPVTVLNTHLESGNAPGVADLRAAQAFEVVARLAAEPRALILGDLNDVPGSPMYHVLAGAGFVDVWQDVRSGTGGFTCCHRDDLSNRVPELDRRLDYVLARGMVRHRTGPLNGSVALLGARPQDRISGPAYTLWPSDHAGVFAELLIGKAN